jgi:hypothetical protein
LLLAGGLRAQDLEPRAYTVSPLNLNFAFLGYNRTTGDLPHRPNRNTDRKRREVARERSDLGSDSRR